MESLKVIDFTLDALEDLELSVKNDDKIDGPDILSKKL
jgi:hypothetical protein